jgi:uncharacterized protein (DUF2461 family)
VKALRFDPRALSFLRALKRNNDREWFKARKEQYDELLRAPMLAIIEQLAIDFRSFAPDLVASPKVSMYRIYRDTRFAEDKSPLKTHVAAMFPRPTHRSCKLSANTSRPTSSGFAPSSSHRDFDERSESSRVNSCSACLEGTQRITRPRVT